MPQDVPSPPKKQMNDQLNKQQTVNNQHKCGIYQQNSEKLAINVTKQVWNVSQNEIQKGITKSFMFID